VNKTKKQAENELQQYLQGGILNNYADVFVFDRLSASTPSRSI